MAHSIANYCKRLLEFVYIGDLIIQEEGTNHNYRNCDVMV